MNRTRALGLILLAAAFMVACTSSAPSGPKPKVIMGSANFGEQVVLGEIYAQALEANGYTVDRKLNLGSREIVAPALEKGEINVYPEYLATYLTFVTKDPNQASPDPKATAQKLADAVKGKGISVLDFAAAQDQNVFVVTKATADKYGLKNVSDLSKANGQLVLGGPPECPDRPFCGKGLKDKYGLTFKDFKALDVGGPITIQSLEGNQIDVGLLFTTNPQIGIKGFVALNDDKGLQQADNIVPVVRTDLLNSAPADFKSTLNNVSSKLSTVELMNLNKALDIDKTDAKVAAAAWLKKQGIVK
ncbi:MAG: ABC transporter substrate-binding protein [Chloroflexi bacterium]|nr:ABC transporter substrate-binding protein [Chloroflexota bacterium]